MESGSSTQQLLLHKETKKDFFNAVVLAVRASLLTVWEQTVLSVSRINGPFVGSMADTCAAPHCCPGARHHD